MPTKLFECCEAAGLETPDRDPAMAVWGTNRYGLHSNILRPAEGGKGTALQGVYYQSPGWAGNSGLGMPYELENEGVYIKQSAWYFQDVDIPRGAAISYAMLVYVGGTEDGNQVTIWNQSGGNPQEPHPHIGKLFAVKEPNPILRCLDNGVGTGYDSRDQGSHYAQYGYRRRWRSASYPQHQRHTDTILSFELSGPNGEVLTSATLPNLAPLIQELVDQPRWKAGNRMCLYPCHGPPTLTFTPTYSYGWAVILTGGSTAATVSRMALTVTYT